MGMVHLFDDDDMPPLLEDEDDEPNTIIRSMVIPRSRPGSLLLLLNLLEVFEEDFGAIQTWSDIDAMIETMDMAALATKRRKTNEAESLRHVAAAAPPIESFTGFTEEAMFSGTDGMMLAKTIDIEGHFNEKVEGKAGQLALFKASTAKHSIGLNAVIAAVTQLVAEDQPEVTRPVTAAIVKADYGPEDVHKKLGVVTTETGLAGFLAVADTVERVATVAGLGGDVVGVTLRPAPQPLAVGRGGGGTKAMYDAIAELRAVPRGTEATTVCPFVDTARGCIKQACLFKH